MIFSVVLSYKELHLSDWILM